MPAQPASHYPKWTGNYIFGNEVLLNLPDHGSLVAAVIAGWSITEAHLGRTLAVLIGAKQPVAMSMYMAARSFDVQRDLLQAAVNEVLPKRYATIFKVAMIVIGRAAAHRHHFAHWIWGASADPALVALLLVEPRNFWSLATAQVRYWNQRRGRKTIERVGPITFAANIPKLSHKHILVYRITDLKEARDQVERAYRIAEALRQFALSNSSRRRQIFHRLSSESDIRQELEKAKNGRPKCAPPPRRQRKSREKS